MQKLNLPDYDLKLYQEDDKLFVFDPFRKKKLLLTPEEHVRQMFAQYLVKEHKFPASLLAMEYSLTLNKMQKRCDILVFDHHARPYLLVECKAPDVKITQAVFDQIARYNLVFKVEYLIVTNGLQHFSARVDYDNSNVDFMKEFPEAPGL